MSKWMSRRHWQIAWILPVAAFVLLSTASVLAAVTGTLTVSAPSVYPGGSTAVDATFSEDASGGVLGGTIVSVVVAPGSGATGTVSLSTADVTCVPASGPQVDCLWSNGTAAKSIALTATASADARGTFDITTQVEGDDPDTPGNDIVVRQIAAATLVVDDPITISVAGPTPNPTTPGSVSTLEVTYTPLADASNVDTSVVLTGTGGNGTLSIVSATNELANCTVDAILRDVSCDYDPTVAAGPSFLTVAIDVGPAAADGDTFGISAQAVRGPVAGAWNIVETRALDIVSAATTTTTTTATTTTTTTMAATTTTTATTSSTLPNTGIEDVGGPMAAGIALVVLGIVLVGGTYALARRNG